MRIVIILIVLLSFAYKPTTQPNNIIENTYEKYNILGENEGGTVKDEAVYSDNVNNVNNNLIEYEKIGTGLCQNLDILEYAMGEAEKVGIDPLLYAALIIQESGCNPNAISKSNAKGVAQIMRGNLSFCGITEEDLFDYKKNIGCSLKLLKEEFVRFKDQTKALMAYNAGSTKLLAGNIVKETRLYPIDINRKLNVLLLQSHGFLRVKSSKFGIDDALYQLVLELKAMLPNMIVTSLNDEAHKGTKSLHYKGRAVDFILGSDIPSQETIDNLKVYCEGKCKVLDEYRYPSKNATGGHVHIELI